MGDWCLILQTYQVSKSTRMDQGKATAEKGYTTFDDHNHTRLSWMPLILLKDTFFLPILRFIDVPVKEPKQEKESINSLQEVTPLFLLIYMIYFLFIIWLKFCSFFPHGRYTFYTGFNIFSIYSHMFLY